MLFIGSLQKPIVLHEINDRIPLVIGLNAMKSLNIDVNEYETFINGYPVSFKVVTVDKIEFCSLSPKLVKQVCLTKSRIWAPNTSKAMTDRTFSCCISHLVTLIASRLFKSLGIVVKTEVV